jgi:hypothetical protein
VPSPFWFPYSKESGTERKNAHFFGWACLPPNHCFEQVGFTLLLYAAIAYSIGAPPCARYSFLDQNGETDGRHPNKMNCTLTFIIAKALHRRNA